MPLPVGFYARDTCEVARELLGCEIWVRDQSPNRRSARGAVRRARIVETEAYSGFDDRACHGWRGETPRLRSLFGPPGRAFVYLTYGIHVMLNVVTERQGFPSGVLIRAAEPLANLHHSTRGPGLLTRALGITRAYDGAHLVHGAVRMRAGSLRPSGIGWWCKRTPGMGSPRASAWCSISARRCRMAHRRS